MDRSKLDRSFVGERLVRRCELDWRFVDWRFLDRSFLDWS